MEVLFYIGLTLCINFIIVTIILWFLKRGNWRANRILGLVFLSIALTNISLSMYSFFNPIASHLLKIHVPIQYAIPPLLYYYLKALFNNNFRFKIIDIIHFLPTILFIVYEFNFFTLPANEKTEWYHNLSFTLNHHYALALLFYIQFALYLGLMAYKYFLIFKRLKPIDAYALKIRKWAKEIFIVITVLLLINIIPVFINPRFILLVTVISSSFYMLILYKVFFDHTIFINLQSSHQIINEQIKIENEQKPTINSDLADSLNTKLEKVLKNEKAYLNSELTLPELAKLMEINYHQLSRFINEAKNTNFNDLVNSMRISEVKKQLLSSENKNLTIEAIGLNVGFNSKAAFYNAFKKFTNSTPSAFRKQHLQ